MQERGVQLLPQEELFLVALVNKKVAFMSHKALNSLCVRLKHCVVFPW